MIGLVKRYYGVFLLIMALLTNALLSFDVNWISHIYFNILFQIFRVTHDYTFGLLPIPSILILLFLLLVWIVCGIYKAYDAEVNKLQKIWLASRSFINAVCLLIALFYLSWGYNYQTNDVEFLSIKNVDEIPHDYVRNEIAIVTKHLDSLRRVIVNHEDSLFFNENIFRSNIENEIRIAQEELLTSWSWPTYGRVRVRRMKPKGFLIRSSASGIYIPHSFEGHIDAGLYVGQQPFTMAHEMAHGYGFTDEGICNFIGFLTCVDTDNTFVQYSAMLAYWRYLIRDVRKIDPCLYDDVRLNISPYVRRDLVEIYKTFNGYPEFFPKARKVVYDSYLKAHGVQAGLVSYSQMTKRLYKWKLNNKDHAIVKQWFLL